MDYNTAKIPSQKACVQVTRKKPDASQQVTTLLITDCYTMSKRLISTTTCINKFHDICKVQADFFVALYDIIRSIRVVIYFIAIDKESGRYFSGALHESL